MADNTQARAASGKTGRHRKWIVHSHEATRPGTSGAMSDINITPLIDVMLVLLIIFMVVTPLAQKGLDIALPQPDPSAAGPTRRNGQPGGAGARGSARRRRRHHRQQEPGLQHGRPGHEAARHLPDRSDKTIFVKAGGKIPYGKVVEAMDIARGAGVERIGIISESMDSGAPAPPPPPTGGAGQ